MEKRTKVEFIESYWKDGNTDYIWNDNHGELIRCKDCKWFTERNGEHLCGAWEEIFYNPVEENGYCYKGERKDEAENG